MKPRFTPALCEYLEGQGFDIHISDTIEHTIKGEPLVIMISILNIQPKDIEPYIKEIKQLAKTECTNG